MSYNKAWRILHAAEEGRAFALLDRSVGGQPGRWLADDPGGARPHDALSGGRGRGGRAALG